MNEVIPVFCPSPSALGLLTCTCHVEEPMQELLLHLNLKIFEPADRISPVNYQEYTYS